jgi:hypothetical protein
MQRCERRRLAERGAFNVDECDCGAIHLTIGCLTLRLDPAAYGELVEAIADSLQNLHPRNKPIIQ